MSRTLQGDWGRRILMPQWQKVVLTFHRRLIASLQWKDNSRLVILKPLKNRCELRPSASVWYSYASSSSYTDRIPSKGQGWSLKRREQFDFLLCSFLQIQVGVEMGVDYLYIKCHCSSGALHFPETVPVWAPLQPLYPCSASVEIWSKSKVIWLYLETTYLQEIRKNWGTVG